MTSDTDCKNWVNEYNIIQPPNDTSLPFFAYGFYKPHQLAYPQIERFVKGNPKKAKAKAFLKQINGIPVLVENDDSDSSNYIEGYLIKFKNNQETDAYERVGYSRNKGIYKWEVMNVDGQRANVLVSSKPKLFEDEGAWYNNYDFNPPKYMKDDVKLECYDWRKDPLFKKPLEYINLAISHQRPARNHSEQYTKSLEIQMLYMLLWVSIDRFLSFRYGETKNNNVLLLSEEKSFRDALKNYVEEDERVFYNRKNVYSTKHLRDYELNPNKPACSAMFYYTIRNNVVHNGKALDIEQDMLLKALTQLLNIFSYVVEMAKHE